MRIKRWGANEFTYKISEGFDVLQAKALSFCIGYLQKLN